MSEAKPRPLCSMYYVYVLENIKIKELYIGYTGDLKRRINQHQYKKIGFKLIYYEAYLSDKLARSRERKLKYYGSAWRALRERITA